MSYQLSADQILEALIHTDHPRAVGWTAQFGALTTGMALELAQHLGIRAGVGVDFEFAVTCVPFYAIYDKQPLPDVFAEGAFDVAKEWGPE